LLNRCSLAQGGVEIPRKLKPSLGAKNNFIGALQMVNEQLDKRLGKGKKRAEWTVDEFGAGMRVLSEILNDLTREIKRLQNVTE
jgi:DNA repair protein RadD